jgi:hypothetical protein
MTPFMFFFLLQQALGTLIPLIVLIAVRDNELLHSQRIAPGLSGGRLQN